MGFFLSYKVMTRKKKNIELTSHPVHPCSIKIQQLTVTLTLQFDRLSWNSFMPISREMIERTKEIMKNKILSPLTSSITSG